MAIARGLLADAFDRSVTAPDIVALDLADAWSELEVPGEASEVLQARHPIDTTATELLLRARIVLRHAIPEITPVARAVHLSRAIRHIDAALTKLDGWTTGGRA